MISCQKVINHFSNSRATTSKWRLLSFQALWWSATTDNIFDKTLTSRKIQKANKNNESNHCVKCPNTELFLVRIFLYSDWIRRFTPQISVFRPNTGKYGPEITPYLDTFHEVNAATLHEFIIQFSLFYSTSNILSCPCIDVNDVVLMPLLLTLNIFHRFLVFLLLTWNK